MTDVLPMRGHHHDRKLSTQSGTSDSTAIDPQDYRKASRPQDIPSRKSSGLSSSFEAARRAVDPSSSPGSGPVYHGRFSRRKNSCDSLTHAGSASEDNAYQGRFGHIYQQAVSEAGDEPAVTGLNSTGDIQGMLNPTKLYHGKFGDTTGSSPPGPAFEPAEAARSAGSGRLHGNVLLRPSGRADPFGPDQEYHGPLE